MKRLHEKDLADGYGRVQLPGALRRKFRQADREWNWQWMFPQHLDPSLVQKAIRRAVIASEIRKPATSHSFRHSFAAHLYTHVLNAALLASAAQLTLCNPVHPF